MVLSKIVNGSRNKFLPQNISEKRVKICMTTHSISPYHYNALQIQPQILVPITSNNYAAGLQKKYKYFF